MNTRESTKSARLKVMTRIAYFGCALCLVGARLSWANVTTPNLSKLAVEVPVVGPDTSDGKLVVLLAFAAAAIVVAFRFAHKRWLAVAALLVGLAIAATGIADSVNFEVSDNEIGGDLFGPILVSVGPGLYVVTLGGLTLAAAAAYLAVTVRGRRRDDVIVGGAGDDALDDGDGRDQLRGGAGDDTLNGGDGRDYVSDGPGADTCTRSETSTQCEK